MSVVFDFNASLSDVAPVSPILLSVDGDEKQCESISFMCCYFYTHYTEGVT